jgi:MFS family permease
MVFREAVRKGVGVSTFAPALREPEFRKLFAGQFVSAFGDAIVPVALPFAVLAVGGSATDIGIVLACGWAPMIVFVLGGGVIGDRLPRRHVMIGSDVVRFAAQTAAAVLLIAGVANIWQLAALQAIWGVAAAFFRPAATALVPQTVQEPQLQSANSLMGISVSVSSLAGPAAAGALVVSVGPGWAFAADASTFLMSVASLALVRTGRLERESGEGDEPAPKVLGQFREGWTAFKSRTWLWVTVLQAGVFHFAVLAPILVLGPIVAETALGGAGAWAVLTGAFGAGSVAGGVAAMHVHPRRPLLVATAFLLPYVLPPILLAKPASLATIAVAVAIAGFGLSVFLALHVTVMQSSVPAAVLSRVSAYDWLGSLVGLPAGFVLAGPLAEAVGVSPVLLGSAVVWLVVTLAVLAVPSVRIFSDGAEKERPTPAGVAGREADEVLTRSSAR